MTGDLDQLERSIAANCATGCTPTQYVDNGYQRTEDGAVLQNRIAVGLLVVGGAVVAGGIAGVILNRPRPHVNTQREASGPTAQIVPTLAHDSGGVAVIGRF